MKKIFYLALPAIGALLAVLAAAQTTPPSADAILDKVDQNAVPGTKILTAEMTIHSRRDSRTLRSRSWIQGQDKAFTEYLDPPREKGTKMLKLGDQLWTYSPDTDRTISISGHMLRQSVMGSDLSYEDMMEDRKLRTAYEAKVEAEETIDGRACWIIAMASRTGEAAYASRKSWVDKERFIVLKEERYAKSGKLLKDLVVQSVIRVGGRWVGEKVTFRDALKQGGGTEFKVLTVEFDLPIPDAVFSKASLRK
jgi:outer membrane lipoprotein-sorting protein